VLVCGRDAVLVVCRVVVGSGVVVARLAVLVGVVVVGSGEKVAAPVEPVLAVGWARPRRLRPIAATPTTTTATSAIATIGPREGRCGGWPGQVLCGGGIT
jgi:hypothetical protein